MAKEPTQIILMPTLDKAEGKAQLVLSTIKGTRGLNSCAHIEYRTPNGMTMFECFGDFRKYFTAAKLPASQKNLDLLHAQNFTPEAVEKLKADALAFYAKKASHA